MAEGDIVVVTGGAGFLGQHIIHLLQEKTSVSEIRAFDIREYKNNMGHQERIPVKASVGDLRRPSDLEQAFRGVDVVFHTASVVNIQTFPDYKAMEEINVVGTANVIRACVKQNVSRLIYTSSVEVGVDDSWDDIHDLVESEPYPERHLYRGYARTKCRAEQLVLAANGTKLNSDIGYLKTVSLRPVGMYGEQDATYITVFLKAAKTCWGSFYTFTNLGAHSISYVGNTAWAHIVAKQTLKENPKVGGQAFIITDDNRSATYAEFAEPFFRARGYRLSKFRIPFWLVYYAVTLMQLVLFFLQPVWKVKSHVPLTRRSMMKMKRKMIFSGQKAREFLGYSPLYTYQESLHKCLPFYEQVPL